MFQRTSPSCVSQSEALLFYPLFTLPKRKRECLQSGIEYLDFQRALGPGGVFDQPVEPRVLNRDNAVGYVASGCRGNGLAVKGEPQPDGSVGMSNYEHLLGLVAENNFFSFVLVFGIFSLNIPFSG